MSFMPRVGVGVLILNQKNQLLLGRRVNSHGDQAWGPPGGHLTFGESFEVCALREVLEEMGVTLKSAHLLGVTNDFFEKDNRHYITLMMQGVVGKDLDPQVLEPEKTSCWKWFDVHDLPKPLFLSLQNYLSVYGIHSLRAINAA